MSLAAFLACRPAPAPGSELAFLFGMLLVPAAIRSICTRPVWSREEVVVSDHCDRCNYDIRGLGEKPTCPECGQHWHERRRSSEVTREPIAGSWLDLMLICSPFALLAPVPWLACYWVYTDHGYSPERSMVFADSDCCYPIVTCALAALACLCVARAARDLSKRLRWTLEASTAMLSFLPAFGCWASIASGGLGPIGADTRMFPLLAVVMFLVAGWFTICATCSPRRYRVV